MDSSTHPHTHGPAVKQIRIVYKSDKFLCSELNQRFANIMCTNRGIDSFKYPITGYSYAY